MNQEQDAQPFVRIVTAEIREEFEVELHFSDGTRKVVDLDPYLRGPVFEPLRANPALFAQLSVDDELGTIVWPNGADLDPDVLYAGGTPTWAQERDIEVPPP